MPIGPIQNTALQGFQAATERANEAAQDIASASVQEGNIGENINGASQNGKDLTTSLVDLKVAEVDALANAKVLKASNELVGSLLDVTV